MRILVYDNTQMTMRGGRYFCASETGKFAQELANLGNDVTMFGQQIEDATSTSSFDILSGGIKTAGLKRYKSKLYSYLLLYLLSIKYIARANFIYFFYPTSFKYLPYVCRLLGKKFGLYIRGTKGVDNSFSKMLYKRAYVVFTVASSFTDMVNTVSNKKNAYTIRPMIAYSDLDVVKDRHYQPKPKYSILYLCRIEKDKGIDELITAINNLIKGGITNFHLRIVGGGGYLETMKSRVDSLQIGEYVSFKGAIMDKGTITNCYREADLYILPSYHEGFPRTLYEAMIFGTPIITTFVGGIPSLMVDNQNCVRIEAHSVKSIEEKIKFALNNYDLMGDYAKNATQTVIKVVDSNRLSHAQDVDRIVRQIQK